MGNPDILGAVPRLRSPDIRLTAVVMALAAAGSLTALLVIRRDNLLTVVLALLTVLFAMTAGVAVAAARQGLPEVGPSDPAPRAPRPGDRQQIDADTLEAMEPVRRDGLRR